MSNSIITRFEVRQAMVQNDVEVIGVYQDVGSKALPPRGPYTALVEKFRKGDAFTGRSGSLQFVRFGGKSLSENVAFVGLGAPGDVTEEKLRSAAGTLWSRLSGEKAKTVCVNVDSFTQAKGLRSGLTFIHCLRAFAEGLALSAYTFNKYKSKAASTASGTADKGKEPYVGPTKIIFVSADKSLRTLLEEEIEAVNGISEAVAITRNWSNEPSNIGTPEYYADETVRLAKHYGLKCRVLTEKEATKEKMNLFLAVGQGSERESRIVVVEYNPSEKGAKREAKTLCYVGKGVTFDSGGISIKPSMRMEEMKHDMTGAATLMGATVLASLWKVPNRIITILAFTENMPDGFAIQPGNVVTARNGKTVEIVNTDAEGRLVLADILDYAQDFKPDAVIDAATLTGAVVVALGKYCAGLMANDDALADALMRTGDECGERIWQLPLYDEYFDDLKSEWADMRNVANDGSGGTIRAAAFMKQFIRKGTKWAHLDIAATAYNVTHLTYMPKRGASGLHVRTLAKFAAEF